MIALIFLLSDVYLLTNRDTKAMIQPEFCHYTSIRKTYIHEHVHKIIHAFYESLRYRNEINLYGKLVGLETSRGPEEDHVVIALFPEVRPSDPVFLEMDFLLLAPQPADERVSHRHLKLLPKFSRGRKKGK